MSATGSEDRAIAPVGPAARALDRLLVAYQHLTAGRISPCRYVPSCSTYAREAVAHHGAARGALYAAGRLGRCHPWGGHGYDPVPGTDDRVSRRQSSRRSGAARRTP